MMPKHTQQHKEKSKREQENLIREKRLMNLRPGSEKMLIDTINKYGDIYRRDYDTC